MAIDYGGGASSRYSYNDLRGFLTGVVSSRAGTPVLDLACSRNAKGQITAVTSSDPAQSWAYGYDGLDRLVFADKANSDKDDVSYAYDDADDLIYNSALCAGSAQAPNLVYQPGPHPHSPVSICGAAVFYDTNGNMLSYDADGAGPQLPRSIAYDGENRSQGTAMSPASIMGRMVSGRGSISCGATSSMREAMARCWSMTPTPAGS